MPHAPVEKLPFLCAPNFLWCFLSTLACCFSHPLLVTSLVTQYLLPWTSDTVFLPFKTLHTMDGMSPEHHLAIVQQRKLWAQTISNNNLTPQCRIKISTGPSAKCNIILSNRIKSMQGKKSIFSSYVQHKKCQQDLINNN